MPGALVTHLDPNGAECDAILEELIATRILRRTPRNAYVLDAAAS